MSRHDLSMGVAEEAEVLFKNLLALSGSKSSLRLREGQRGRGLFAASAVAQGEEVLSVPLSACLVEPRHISDEEAEKVLGRPLSQGMLCCDAARIHCPVLLLANIM
jgi:hypothetical protein